MGPLPVLLLSDDVPLAAAIRGALRDHAVAVDVAATGDVAMWMADGGAYDVIVVDAAAPGIAGVRPCIRLRRKGVRAPILLLAGPGALVEPVTGPDRAAQQVLAKPVSLPDLVVQVQELARGGAPAPMAVLCAGELRLEPAARRVFRAGHEIALSVREFAVLEVLMRHAGAAVDRLALEAQAWPAGARRHSNVIDVYIRYLREKVDRPFGVRSIETVRGVGYRLRGDGGEPDGRVRRARQVMRQRTV